MAYEFKQGKYLQFERIRKYVEYKKITPRSYPGRILLSILYHKASVKSSKKRMSGSQERPKRRSKK